jgi:hypothetical protein
MKKCIRLVLVLLYEVLMVTTTTKADIFFSFSPHVRWIAIHGYKNGWDPLINPDMHLLNYQGTMMTVDIDNREGLITLIKALKELRKK